MAQLAGTRVLLGVAGGIAAYKSADLVRRLRDVGADVRVVMTENAQRFITPLTLQALSGNPVRTALWDEAAEAAMGHIELARWAELIVVAPATADLVAKLASGRADDLLTTLCLASAARVALAPAMNQQMWSHPAVQANVATLAARGVVLLGPASGSQACGEFGAGRMLESSEIVTRVLALVAPGMLSGARFLVSAGPTYEDIDPVRFIGNRSSGRMGFAVAQAAVEAGAAVTLVAGPVSLPTPAGVTRIDVRSASEMLEAVFGQVDRSDVFVAAAAVADFRMAETSPQKIKKNEGASRSLDLVATRDILAELGAREHRPFLVGFAAESEQLEQHARAKLSRKHLDLIAANRIGEPGTGFEAEHNEITLYWADGQRKLARATKQELARELVAEIAQRRGRSTGAAA